MRFTFRSAALACSGLLMSAALPVSSGVLTTESFSLPYGPGNSVAAPTQDMVVNTSPLSTWGEKGAVGLQGSQSVFYNGSAYVNEPASIVAFKFNIGSTVDSLNSTYGVGNWTIANPKLTFEYTYYANNNIFGGGAGTFQTYWVANDNWAFSNTGTSGNSYGDSKYVAGTDPVYATSAAGLASWAGSMADLGSTTYNWLSPANNPNYTGWTTDNKGGLNQGMLTDALASDPQLINDITSATGGSDPNVSLYMMPTSDTLGLTIFTGGGNAEPMLSFDVVSTPEPATVCLIVVGMIPLLRRRRA